MYHPTVEELNKTPWEKQMAQQMTLDNSGVTLSYRNVLYIIQQHLKTLYGDMADWNKNVMNGNIMKRNCLCAVKRSKGSEFFEFPQR